jgi:hypothetical protein
VGSLCGAIRVPCVKATDSSHLQGGDPCNLYHDGVGRFVCSKRNTNVVCVMCASRSEKCVVCRVPERTRVTACAH